MSSKVLIKIKGTPFLMYYFINDHSYAISTGVRSKNTLSDKTNKAGQLGAGLSPHLSLSL